MKIAYGTIAHETNSFSSLRTGEKEFRIWRGEEIDSSGDFWEAYRAQGVTMAPLLIAQARPNGMADREFYLRIKGELLERLEASLPVDGMFLPMHGAMEVEGIGDGESDLVSSIRRLLGEEIPIAVSLDLHGNVAPGLAASANIVTAFRTSPHRDDRLTRQRAVDHLIRAIREGLRPETALVKIPLLMPGEYALTDFEPAKSLYAKLAEIESEPGIMDASLLTGCAASDSPWTSASALVVSERPGDLARRFAVELALAVWEKRFDFGPSIELAEPEEAIARALSEPEGPVMIDDIGDNFTAGAAGDVPELLRLLMEAGATDAIVAGINDPQSVDRCVDAGLNSPVRLEIGGKRDTINGTPYAASGIVTHLYPSEQPSRAVVQSAGIRIILTREHVPFFGPGAFAQIGIDPLQAKIIVVKHLFPGLQEISRRSIYALGPGFTDWHLDRRPYRRLTRPIFPLDPGMEWRP
jgi:microcystin degradation protein MlrC